MFHHALAGISCMRRTTSTLRRLALAFTISAVLATPARAHGPSEASSAASVLPVAMLVAAPSLVLAAGATFTVVAVQASAEGTVWVLERAADGARATLRLAGASLVTTGAVLTVSTVASGWLVSQAGRALCFIPSEAGATLLYNERVTR